MSPVPGRSIGPDPGGLPPAQSGTIAGRLAKLCGVVPWYSDRAAARWAAERGLSLGAPPAEVVHLLHDKAFCARVAAEVAPSAFTHLVRVLEPDLLSGPYADGEIRAALAAWPEAWRRRFVLKPRFGTSGRGRVEGSGDGLDAAGLRALSRLAQRGGALLEPWAQRTTDLSALFWVRRDGAAVPLGATTQVLGENGLYLGQRGTFERTADGALLVGSGHRMEPRFLGDCRPLLRAAAAAGFHGPCGVDAFAYRSPEGGEMLRSLVEFNARFTVGTVAVGWLERVLSTNGHSGEWFAGEWWFTLTPTYARRLRGSDGVPSAEDGWTVVRLGSDENPAVLGLR